MSVNFLEFVMSFRLLVIVAACLITVAPSTAQNALITFLHNSPEPSLRVADLYITQAGVTTKVEDLDFRKADNLSSVAIFADFEATFAVAPGSSTNVNQAIVSETFTPLLDKGYMAILQGVQTPASYVANPDGRSTALAITTFIVDASIVDPNKSGVYFVHGSPDLESGDFWIRGGTTALDSSLTFLDYSTTISSVSRTRSTIDFTKRGDKTKPLASFSVDFASLSSSVVVCVLSGFKTPADNAGSLDTLALVSVLDDGRVVTSPLIAGSQTSRVQIIHTAADPLLTMVDIWVNGTKAFENVLYNKATTYVPLPANTPMVVGFAPATSTAYRDTLRTVLIQPLRPGRVYSLVASGVLDTAKFRDNPNGTNGTLKISSFTDALEQSPDPTKTAVRVGNFSTDSPPITLANASVRFESNLGYLAMSPVYTLVTPAIDTIWVLDSGNIKRRGYVCDLRGTNKSFVVLASGFEKPDSNMAGPAFKLILVESNGNVIANLTEVDPGMVSVEENIDPASTWNMGPNPAGDVLLLSIPIRGALNGSYMSEIISVNGEIVLATPLMRGQDGLTGSVSLQALATGTYRLRVVSSDGTLIGSRGLVVAR